MTDEEKKENLYFVLTSGEKHRPRSIAEYINVEVIKKLIILFFFKKFWIYYFMFHFRFFFFGFLSMIFIPYWS